MTLTDPTGGAGYPFGTLLPSAHMTTIATNQPKAVDGDGGGTWNPTTTITLGGQGLTCSGTTLVKLASRNITRRRPMRPDVISGTLTANGSEGWTDATAGSPGAVWRTTLDLPHGQVLNSVHMRIDPAGAHGAGAVTPPVFTLYKIAVDGTATLLATSSDATGGTIPAYEAAHDIEALAIAHTIDRATYAYSLAVAGEVSGTSLYVQNLIYVSLRIICACTSYPEY